MDNHYILSRDGTSQNERFPEALRDKYVQIDERSFEDFVHQSAEYARRVIYYDENNQEAGDWCAFFEEIYDYDTKSVRFSSFEDLEKQASLSPHLSLFLAFLRLYQIAQENLNTLGRRHLDFYYRDILHFSPHKALADKVDVFFELNKNIDSVRIPAGSTFMAGKKPNGEPLTFIADNDLIVNHGAVDKRYEVLENDYENTFVVSGESLNLKDGNRSLDFGTLQSIVSVEYTTEDGWQKMQKGSSLGVWVANETMPPFAVYKEQLHRMQLPLEWPAVRITLSVGAQMSLVPFTLTVTDTNDFVLQNKHAEINHDYAFKPYGMQPQKGDWMRVTSIAGMPYTQFNRLQNVRVVPDIVWDAPSVNLKSYYKGYRTETGLLPQNIYQTVSQLPPGWVREVSDLSNRNQLTWTLMYELGHSVYQYLYALALRKDASRQIIPQPPLIPVAQKMTLSYSFKIPFNSDAHFKVFHVFDHGHRTVGRQSDLHVIKNGHQSLMLGIKNLNEPSILSLFFKMSLLKDVDYDISLGKNDMPVWSYYTSGHWETFRKNQIIKDTTKGMLQDGIVYLSIPSEAFQPNDLFTDGNVWLRLEYPFKKAGAFPAIEDVLSQVLELRYVDSGTDVSFYPHELPAGTVTRLAVPVKGVQKVYQPYPSFGGRAAEDTQHFYMRVSERLRHKNRAWTAWDYERLILEEFPFVYKAKCLPATSIARQPAAGETLIVLFPELKGQHRCNELEPKIGVNKLQEIQKFLSQRSSPFVKIAVTNASYEAVKVKCQVVYRPEFNDIAYYNHQLNEDLKHFLAPWTQKDENDASYHSLYVSQISSFIENRPYVDYIKDIIVYVGTSERQVRDGELICPAYPDHLLTSATEHIIN